MTKEIKTKTPRPCVERATPVPTVIGIFCVCCLILTPYASGGQLDMDPPVISCPPDVTVECDGSIPGPGVTGEPMVMDADPSPVISASDVVIGNCPQIVTRTFRATDSSGNTSTCDQIISIEDTTPPVISCPADFVSEIATANDACDPAVVVTFQDQPDGSREWTATDSCGNADSCIQLLCDPNPSTQGYWHRQCLGVPASEGGLDPGRNGRGPRSPTEPNFDPDLMMCADTVLGGLPVELPGVFGVTTCEGMDADPPSDDCERALKQLTALILNVCSDRLQLTCPVCLDTVGTFPPNVELLISDIASYILADMCKAAAEMAALANEGEAICVLDD